MKSRPKTTLNFVDAMKSRMINLKGGDGVPSSFEQSRLAGRGGEGRGGGQRDVVIIFPTNNKQLLSYFSVALSS